MGAARRALPGAALVLIVGFAALALPFVQAFFDVVALALTHLSKLALEATGFDLVRDGTELRASGAGWAIRVTEVCDGHGILIAWVAILSALSGSWRQLAVFAAMGFGGVQIFNFFRVIVLALVLDAEPGSFEDVHLFFFPLLTTIFLATLATLVRPISLVFFAAATIAFAALWFIVTEPVSGAVLTPLANGFLALIGPAGINGVSGSAPDWIVDTAYLVSREPVQLLAMPFYPPDFAIALPVVAAAVAATWRPAALSYLALWAVLGVIAMAIGMITSGWAGAEAQNITQQIVPQGDGRAVAIAYQSPSDAIRGLTELVQNLLVHFNLLVLPVLILGADDRTTSD
ncbi:MAG: hypothetical protein AAF439_03775 [Pseudomonadota bacterium]